jgi:phage tail protein X
MEYITKDDETLDQICFKHYGVTNGILEIVLTSNPHLSESDVFLKGGLTVFLPPLERQVNKETVRLWD